MNKNHLIISGTLIIVVGAASFYAGTKYQQVQRGTMRGNFTGNQNAQNSGRAMGFRPVKWQ